jgi:hypothetical protein
MTLARTLMIRYCINPIHQGYRLTIWEPAALTSSRVQPFHFKLNFTTISVQEAENILNLIPGEKTQAFIPNSSSAQSTLAQKVLTAES